MSREKTTYREPKFQTAPSWKNENKKWKHVINKSPIFHFKPNRFPACCTHTKSTVPAAPRTRVRSPQHSTTSPVSWARSPRPRQARFCRALPRTKTLASTLWSKKSIGTSHTTTCYTARLTTARRTPDRSSPGTRSAMSRWMPSGRSLRPQSAGGPRQATWRPKHPRRRP